MAEIVTVSKLFRIVAPARGFMPLANLISITRCHPLHSIHLVSRTSMPPLIILHIDPSLVVHLPNS